MTHCANPDCPKSQTMTDLMMKSHWVQIEELDIQQYNEVPGQGIARRTFSATTCSKRCAAVVLAAQADVDEQAQESIDKPFI